MVCHATHKFELYVDKAICSKCGFILNVRKLAKING